MNNEFRNYYNELGLPNDGKYHEGIFQGYYISQDGIDKAMNRIKREFGWGSRQVEKAQEAYNVLSNPIKRAEYNAKLEEYIKNPKMVDNDSNLNQDEIQETNDVEEIGEEKKSVTSNTQEVPVEEVKQEENKPLATVEEEQKVETSKVSEEEDKQEENKIVSPVTEEHKSVEEPIKNNTFDEKLLEEAAIIKADNKKRIIKNALIVGGATLFGPIGTIASIIILKKNGKLKLQKLPTKGNIKDIKTLESEIIQTENKSLEAEIDKLLNSPLRDNQSRYKLEIAKLRYQHQVELLQKRIEFKKEQKVKLGDKAYNALYVLSLEKRFAAAIKFLETRKAIVEAKLNALNSYNPNKDKKDNLTKIQEEIVKTKNELNNSKISNFSKSNKYAKLVRLNSKKIQKIDKMALKKNGISRNQVALAVFNLTKDKVTNLFSHKDQRTDDTIDLMSSSKKVH